MEQNLSQLEISEKYLRNLETGVIVAVNKYTAEEIERNNRYLEKRKLSNSIEFEVLTRNDIELLIAANPGFVPIHKRRGRK